NNPKRDSRAPILPNISRALRAVLKIINILLFHRKRCENCTFRPQNKLYCEANRKSTKMLNVCEKWKKDN
ncbi:MAG: hypothetical protein WCR86_11495, partial [Parabacteroides sp.]